MFATSCVTRAVRALAAVLLAGVAFDACGRETPATPPPPAASPVVPAESAPPAPALQPAKPGVRPHTIAPAWKTVTVQLIDEKIDFTRLPADSNLRFTPIARTDDQPEQEVVEQLILLGAALQTWPPGKVADPVQRVRNLLYIPAAADMFALPTESYIPAVVFAHIRQAVPQDDLIKVLYWIAYDPDAGDDRALDDLQAVGLPGAPSADEARNRAGFYAVKFLGRLMGRINAP